MRTLLEALDALRDASVGGAIAAILGSVLLLSGGIKLRNPLPAAIALVNFGVARRVRPAWAYILGGLEVTVGLSLILRIAWPVPALAALTMFAGFFTAIASALLMKRQLECACFGEANAPLGLPTLARAVLLVGLSVMATAASLQPLSSQDALSETVTGVALLAILVLLSAAWRLRRLNQELRSAIEAT